MSTDYNAKVILLNPKKRMAEFYVWCLLSALVGGRFLFVLIFYGNKYFIEELPSYYYDILAMILVMFFPVLFLQIFGRLPFEYIRLHRSRISEWNDIEDSPLDESAAKSSRIETNITDSNAVTQMQILANSSKEISEGLYTRAGVYLLIGVIIAFSGLAFFYIETAKDVPVIINDLIEKPTSSSILDMLPKFGILFFIEMVAFFFLRQYREAMDEYRYYESIKRRREENLILLKLNSETPNSMSLNDLLGKIEFYSDQKSLKSGESTEILESRKLGNHEIALMEKMLAVITSNNK
ncbi:hypothetical protein ACK3ZY_05595 [Aeromonas caviae]